MIVVAASVVVMVVVVAASICCNVIVVVGVRRPPLTSEARSRSTLYYLLSLAVATVGASYAAVPLYRAFCQSTGFGGTVKEGQRDTQDNLTFTD